MSPARVGQARRRDEQAEVSLTIEGRVPPHDLGAEQALLSAGMLSREVLDEIDWLRPDHFYSEAHRHMWDAETTLHRAGEPVDSVMVATWLRDRDRLQQVGGVAYVAATLSAAPVVSLQNAVAYARTIYNKHRERQIILASIRHAAEGYVDHGTTEEWANRVEREVQELAGGYERRKPASIGEVVRAVYDNTVRAQAENRLPGIPTGFRDLDEFTAGLHPGDLTIIAARPGMGKTGFVVSMACKIARTPPELFGPRSGLAGVGIYSLEMPRDQLVSRAMSVESRVEFQSLRKQRLTPEQWQRLSAGCGRLSKLAIEIDDTPALELSALRGKIRRLRGKMSGRDYLGGNCSLQVLVIDYLQLMRCEDENARSREQEIGKISRGLKELAKDEGLPIIALAQLSRAVEQRGDKNKRPGLADLRESGSIEQDADNVIFIYRGEYYGEKMPEGEEGKTELIIAKQRNGPTGTVFTRFRAAYTSFEDMP